MATSPRELAELASIPVEAAELILNPPPDIDEKERRRRLEALVLFAKEQRNWVWEIHKNCDQLLHQRLASFTAAQAMTLASFTLLTVARFNADPGKIAPSRILLLDISRVGVTLFGVFLAVTGYLVTYPMVKRLKYLNDKFFFPNDKIYRNYFDCIEWDENTWSPTSKGRFPYAFYRNIIPRWLPLAEGLLWVFLLLLLVFGISISSLGRTSVG
jgi:hypothetical protein